MKKLVFILYIVLLVNCNNRNEDNLVTSIQNSSISKDKLENRYGVKSGIVKYTVLFLDVKDSIRSSSKEQLYFKDWGAIQIEEKTESSTNFSYKEKYSIRKIENGIVSQVNFNSQVIIQQKYTIKNTNKGKKIGHEIRIGYDCEIWQYYQTKQWIYKGVVLKLENNFMDIKMIKEATKADFNTIIPSNYFELPNYPLQKKTLNE